MFKHKRGAVENPITGERVDIIVDTKPNTFKECMIGVIIIGIGVTYLTMKAFENGSVAYEKGELAALDACMLLGYDVKK